MNYYKTSPRQIVTDGNRVVTVKLPANTTLQQLMDEVNARHSGNPVTVDVNLDYSPTPPPPLRNATSEHEVMDITSTLLELPPLDSPCIPTRNPDITIEPQSSTYLINTSGSSWNTRIQNIDLSPPTLDLSRYYDMNPSSTALQPYDPTTHNL